MRLPELLFSFKGRIGRQSWWLASLAVGVIAGMLNSLIELAAKVTGNGAIDPETNEFEPSGVFLVGVLAVTVINAWINYALCTKHLHDRERSGWWLVVQAGLILLMVAIAVGAMALSEAERNPFLVAAGVVGALAFALSLWLFVLLGFLKGTQGPNAYGPDPLAERRADAELKA